MTDTAIANVSWPLRLLPLLLPAMTTLAYGADDNIRSKFIDPSDGQFDMRGMLLNHKGVLPVPAIITEPAIGYGFGLALLYFSAAPHAESISAGDDPQTDTDTPPRKFSPPNITGIGGFFTGHTWICAACRRQSFRTVTS